MRNATVRSPPDNTRLGTESCRNVVDVNITLVNVTRLDLLSSIDRYSSTPGTHLSTRQEFPPLYIPVNSGMEQTISSPVFQKERGASRFQPTWAVLADKAIVVEP